MSKIQEGKMRQSVKKAWLKALRSGNYEQTVNTLKNDTGYCCLGVLCDVHRKTVKKTGCTWKDGSYLGESTILPPEVMKWAGVTDENGHFRYKNGVKTFLTVLNDKKRFNFKEIAKVIEKNF